MHVTVNGSEVFVATGGKEFDAAKPSVVFLHGAGFDHSVWALYTRWFAHNGYNALAPDLPGHGPSGGDPLPSVEAIAEWTAALIDATGAKPAKLIGHSLGSLIAVETAARHPEKVSGLGLIATAAAMPVSEALLAAAKANSSDAIAMMTIWGFGHRAGLGGSLTPGGWMMGKGVRVLEAAKPGVLYTDQRERSRRENQRAHDAGACGAGHDDAVAQRQGPRRAHSRRIGRDARRRGPHAACRKTG
jgi:pimeloyl-ACP methyl ester carboxylesterase